MKKNRMSFGLQGIFVGFVLVLVYVLMDVFFGNTSQENIIMLVFFLGLPIIVFLGLIGFAINMISKKYGSLKVKGKLLIKLEDKKLDNETISRLNKQLDNNKNSEPKSKAELSLRFGFLFAAIPILLILFNILFVFVFKGGHFSMDGSAVIMILGIILVVPMFILGLVVDIIKYKLIQKSKTKV